MNLILRPYQREALNNQTNGIEVWMWGRQTGKSFTLACWAVERLLSRPGRLVTILSNSVANGAELNQKCAQIARFYQQALAAAPDHNPTLNPNPILARTAASALEFASLNSSSDQPFASATPGSTHVEHPLAPLGERERVRGSSSAELSIEHDDTIQFDCLVRETRITVDGKVGRIKILPANPRTARGFSGDLILDEFAFHEDSTAIWEAAEPILSANPDYLCRIASTPNGRHNMFYRLINDPCIPKRIISRSEAWRQGMPIYHPVTRQPMTPDQARALAHDKRAYDQNYECIFESENMTLLTHDLISAAEDPAVGVICDDQWSQPALAFLNHNLNLNLNPDLQEGGATLPRSLEMALRTPQPAIRNLFVGVDVGRHHDLTAITVLEKSGDTYLVRAILRLRNVRLPQQQELLEIACRSPRFAGAVIDMTGLGLGLYEYTRQKFGNRISGLNFACSLPVNPLAPAGTPNSKIETARAPEVLALRLLQTYESKRVRHPVDSLLREDLRKPERITTPEGRVSIVASRDEAGHADHFWSLALALHAATLPPVPVSACATSVFVGGRSNMLHWATRPQFFGSRRRSCY